MAKVGQKCASWDLICLLGGDQSEGEGALKAGGLAMGRTDGRGTALHSGLWGSSEHTAPWLQLPRTTLGKGRAQQGAVRWTSLHKTTQEASCLSSAVGSLPGLPSPAGSS